MKITRVPRALRRLASSPRISVQTLTSTRTRLIPTGSAHRMGRP